MASSNPGKAVGVAPLHQGMVLCVFVLTTLCIPAFALPGDANHDGTVNLDDFMILKQNFGTTAEATWETGDFDGDGDVSLDDFVILKTNFGAIEDPQGAITLDCGDGVTLDLVRIAAGTFMMGSPTAEQDHDGDEEPVRQVTISLPFYMGVYEVTQRQYQALMGTNPSSFTASGLDAPVEFVSWNDAKAFCDALSTRTGRAVMLPTEAQWEYACRAGSTTRFYYGDDANGILLGNYAWYGYWDGSGNSGGETHLVGQKIPNAWGLYDMHGNVWEWCADWYGSYASANAVDPLGPVSGTSRVVRGGCWGNNAPYCRSANRSKYTPDITNGIIGFRVVAAPGGLD